MAALISLFRKDAQPENVELKNQIVSTIRSLHISCAFECLATAKSCDNFIGICILHKDGDQKFEDNGRRIKSGYIFVIRPSDMTTVGDTRHRQAYNMLFKDIENKEGVCIIGFSQQDKVLKGTSGTFNTSFATTLVPNRPRDCLFIFRSLIFGALINYKLSGSRNTSPHAACLGLCLFLIIKNDGDKGDLEKFPVSELELSDETVFIRELFTAFNIQKCILDIAIDYQAYWRITRWARVQYAMKELMTGLKNDMTEQEFRNSLNRLSEIYDTGFFAEIFRWLIKIFFPLLP